MNKFCALLVFLASFSASADFYSIMKCENTGEAIPGTVNGVTEMEFFLDSSEENQGIVFMETLFENHSTEVVKVRSAYIANVSLTDNADGVYTFEFLNSGDQTMSFDVYTNDEAYNITYYSRSQYPLTMRCENTSL